MCSSIDPRRRLFTALLLPFVLLLASCGGGSDEGTGTPSGDAGSDAFPVTLEHKFGSTTIDEQPERVLAIGFNEQDYVLALGVEPVGVREFLSYDAPNRPWAPDSVKGKDLPTVGAEEINLEKVAELAPDVIIGINSYIDKPTYDLLNKIAPTVAQSDEYSDGATPWDQQTLQTGRALGQEAPAEKLVEETKALFTAARDEHPEFEGATAAFALGSSDSGTWNVGQDDYRSAWLTELGFEVAETGGDVGYESLSVLDRDVLVAEGVRDADLDRAVFQQLTAVKEGRLVDLGAFDDDFAGALGFNSPLSIPYLLETAVPRLAAAVDGDTSTEVESYPSG